MGNSIVLQADLERRLPFPFGSAVVEQEGPVRSAEEDLDQEAVRLRVAKELNDRVLPGQEETVRQLAKLPGETPVAYIVWRSGDRRAKCYFDLLRQELVGVMRLDGE